MLLYGNSFALLSNAKVGGGDAYDDTDQDTTSDASLEDQGGYNSPLGASCVQEAEEVVEDGNNQNVLNEWLIDDSLLPVTAMEQGLFLRCDDIEDSSADNNNSKGREDAEMSTNEPDPMGEEEGIGSSQTLFLAPMPPSPPSPPSRSTPPSHDHPIPSGIFLRSQSPVSDEWIVA
jgi:hypothetical protein